MRTIVLAVLLSASSFTLHAQYTGGSSDGDDEDEILNKLFNGNTATATGFVFLTHPSNTTVWKNTVAAMLDVVSSNNLQFGGSTSITLSLASNPGTATLSGTTTLNASSGRASFSGLYLDKSGTGYTLSASATGLNSATGNTFNVSAASLSMRSQPPSSTYANQPFGLSVAVVDANGTQLTLANPSLSLSIATNPGSSTLSGTTAVQASAGLATFSGLSLNNDGMGYVLQIANPDMNSLNTQAFDVFSNLTFLGGNSDGDDVATLTATLPVSGHRFWIGGLGAISTDWNDALNWLPNTAVPGQSDRIAIEPNNNGHNPILDQNRTVNSLNFNGANKKVELGNYTLTLTGDATGFNSNNYFKTNGTGKIVRNSIADAGIFSFPVGNSSYNPVTITNNTGTADNFSVRVADAVLLGGTSGNGITTPRVNRTWHIDKTNPTANEGAGVDMDFSWDPAQETDTMAAYTLNHHNGNGWVFATGYGGNQQVTGSNPKTLAFRGYMGSFSPFAIGGDLVSPLPIVLQEFTAACAEDAVTLNWITQSEINNERFFIHRSADLIQWEEVLTLSGAGNSNAPLSYTATDDRPLKGMSYYRLTQQDYDGTAESFEPIPVFCQANGEEANTLQVYPNPAEEMFTVSIYVSQTIPEALLELYDLNGRVVSVRTLSAEKGNNAFSIRREGLVSGTYILCLRSEKLALNPVKVVLK